MCFKLYNNNEVSSSGSWSSQHAVTGKIRMYIADGTTITTADSYFTLRQMLEAIAKDTSGYSQTQMNALQNANWAITSILPQA